MTTKHAWTDEEVRTAVAASTTYRETLERLGAGGSGSAHWNVRARIQDLALDTAHFSRSTSRVWTDEQLRAAVSSSTSYGMTAQRLGLSPNSGGSQTVRRRILDLQLDVSHFVPSRGRPYSRRTKWTDDDLRAAVASSHSIAAVIRQIGLVAAGGNYDQVQRRIRDLAIDTSHMTGKGWNTGLMFKPRPPATLDEVLVANRPTSSNKLKKRLIREGLKPACCELCGWAERAPDGRLPLELDHINGDKNDNRIENLRILCPNCHALQPTHRGLNQRRRRS